MSVIKTNFKNRGILEAELLDGFTVFFRPLENREYFYHKHYFSQPLNREEFLLKLVSAVVVDWAGLEVHHLYQLCPYFEWNEFDMDMPVPYSEEAAYSLIEKSPQFRTFVVEHGKYY